jgi:hypothetical protein
VNGNDKAVQLGCHARPEVGNLDRFDNRSKILLRDGKLNQHYSPAQTGSTNASWVSRFSELISKN